MKSIVHTGIELIFLRKWKQTYKHALSGAGFSGGAAYDRMLHDWDIKTPP